MTLLELAATDPARAYAIAAESRSSPDPAERVAALRALALTGKELGLMAESLPHLHEALSTAMEAGLPYEAAQVRSSLVALLAARGQVDRALAAADAAAGVLRGGDAVRLAANRICALTRGGMLSEARAFALRTLAETTPQTPPGLLTNVGLALATCGEFEAGEACVSEATRRADRAGLRHEAAMCRANLAFMASRQGRLALALSLFAEAEPDLATSGPRAAQVRLDRAETLVAAGRADEARALAAHVLTEMSAAGHEGDVADGLVVLARAELADGDPEQAAETAERARTVFSSQQRPGWALLAEHLLIRARWAAGDRTPIFLSSATASAGRLSSNGWRSEAADGHIVAARLAICLGRSATSHLAHVEAARHEGSASLRADAWQTTALGRHRAGDRRGALAAVRAGLRIVTDHQPSSAELRVGTARWGAELAEFGLRLAGSARELLAAEERRRMLTWRFSSSPPPIATSIEVLADRALVELIQIGDELHAVTVVNGRHRRTNLGPFAPIAHEARLTTSAIRRLAWRQQPDESPEPGRRLESLLLEPLARWIGERELVIAPTGLLHGVPWAALPMNHGRPFSMVPAASLLAPRDIRTGHTLLVAGPGLPHAEREIAALAALHPTASVLMHDAATIDAVRHQLSGAALAHLAAHGTFRPEAPLNSALHLADGPLPVTALTDLDHPPTLVVLSACDSGLAADPDAVLGLAATFLALGTSGVVASVTPIRDDAASTFMTAFHQRLAAGLPPARALAEVPRTPGVLGFQYFGR